MGWVVFMYRSWLILTEYPQYNGMILLILDPVEFPLRIQPRLLRINLTPIHTVLVHSLRILNLLMYTSLALSPIFVGQFQPFVPALRLEIDQLDASFGLFDGMAVCGHGVFAHFYVLAHDFDALAEDLGGFFGLVD